MRVTGAQCASFCFLVALSLITAFVAFGMLLRYAPLRACVYMQCDKFAWFRDMKDVSDFFKYTQYEDSGTVTVGRYQNSGAQYRTLDIKF